MILYLLMTRGPALSPVATLCAVCDPSQYGNCNNRGKARQGRRWCLECRDDGGGKHAWWLVAEGTFMVSVQPTNCSRLPATTEGDARLVRWDQRRQLDLVHHLRRAQLHLCTQSQVLAVGVKKKRGDFQHRGGKRNQVLCSCDFSVQDADV